MINTTTSTQFEQSNLKSKKAIFNETHDKATKRVNETPWKQV